PGWRRVGEGDLALYTPERIGGLSMLCLVVVFGAHSLVDWTWYVPGDACVALMCAGWLAGRGPLAAVPVAARTPFLTWKPGEPGFVRTAVLATVIVAALLGAWSQWQPLRAEDAREEALGLLATNRPAANAAAEEAVARDPLSVEALFTLADVQKVAGQRSLARATLQRAVRLQPSNPQTWLELARFDLSSDPKSALAELQASIYLNPESIAAEAITPPGGQPEAIEIYNDYIQALRASARAAALKNAIGSRSPGAGAVHPGARRGGRSG